MFHTNTKNGITYLTADTLCGVCHGFSTRPGGVSPAPWDSLNLGVGRGDDMENVRENYRRFCAAVGTDAQRVVLSKQIHEDGVRHVTEADAGKGLWRERDYSSVDSMVTDAPHLPLVVFSADCNVILLHDPVRGTIGACHAGWRGTALGIAAKTVREMVRLFGCDTANIHAAIGPAIGQCCFETDADVPEAMREAFNWADEYISEGRAAGKFYVDLKGVNKRQLEEAGVRNIEVSDICTCCNENFCSHRRNPAVNLRMASGICLLA